MSYRVIPTDDFKKDVKSIYKKYKNVKNDLLNFVSILKSNPKVGVSLGDNLYKVRVKNSDNKKGKSD